MGHFLDICHLKKNHTLQWIGAKSAIADSCLQCSAVLGGPATSIDDVINFQSSMLHIILLHTKYRPMHLLTLGACTRGTKVVLCTCWESLCLSGTILTAIYLFCTLKTRYH